MGACVQGLLSDLRPVRTLSVTLAERVKAARKGRGLTQRELADKTQLSAGYISMLEQPPGGDNAIASPGLPGLQKIAEALDVPEGWLVLGHGVTPEIEPFPRASGTGPEAAE